MLLRDVVQDVRRRHRFAIHGGFVMRERIDSILELPASDTDFATPQRLIKAGFPKRLPATEQRSEVRRARGEIPQRAYWKYLIGSDFAVAPGEVEGGRRNALRLLRPTRAERIDPPIETLTDAANRTRVRFDRLGLQALELQMLQVQGVVALEILST